MVLDGLRGYLQLATGLTEVTRERAVAAAKSLAAQGESVGAVLPDSVRTQVGSLADDLMTSSRANRVHLTNLVRSEVERSVARLGLVSAVDLQSAERRAKALGRRVEELEQQLTRRSRARSGASSKKSGAKKSSAKKSTSTTASAKKKASATKSSAQKATAKKSPSKKSPSKKSTRKTPPSKSARSAAKKSSST